ncbi:MAG: ribosomal RNA small subunit methyltransferase A [Sphaerochaetaceae bacterium]|nr:ribosomal RNA small subunit methyltransferase A [Sphaerochaetaceae bacterium]
MSWTFRYDSPSEIHHLLESHSLAMSKKFGQNFLLSHDTRTQIAEHILSEGARNIWEIGPGIGNITSVLLEKGCDVTAFEIDRGFISILKEEAFVDEPGFHLVEGDFLKTWPLQWLKEPKVDVIAGNLPYNVGSVILARLLEQRVGVNRMVFTLQKEVIDRMCSPHGSKMFSTLSILAQVDYHVEKVMTIKAGSFYPSPKVDSALVTLTLRETSLVSEHLREIFFLLVHDLFAARRKTVRNNLINGRLFNTFIGQQADQIERILKEAGISPMERAEKLPISTLVVLSEVIYAYGKDA